MRITTLSLKNYRVFADLELELPAGLVGVYGVNGAGKSSLLESITWALYGRARTSKNEIRTSGVSAECLVEIGFEHEGHHYRVRRSVTGVNSTVKARMFAGEEVVADGSTEVAKFVRSTLGMEESAFRSSVFTEQKQLSAFSDQSPEHRRRLVLQLLGITPIEKARDAARSDARSKRADYERFIAMLPDSSALQTSLEEAFGQERAATLSAQKGVQLATDAAQRRTAAAQVLAKTAESKAAYELIKARGLAARAERDRASTAIASLSTENEALAGAADRLNTLQTDLESSTPRDVLERQLATIRQRHEAQAALDRLRPEAQTLPAPPNDAEVVDLRSQLQVAESAFAAAEATRSSVAAAVRKAEDALRRTESLDAASPCTLCGQTLGEEFSAVVRHHEAELAQARQELSTADLQVASNRALASELRLSVRRATTELQSAQANFDRAVGARAKLELAAAQLDQLDAALAKVGVSPNDLSVIESELRRLRALEQERSELTGRLARRESVALALAEEEARLDRAEADRAALLVEIERLRFDPKAAATAEQSLADAESEEQAALRESRRSSDQLVQITTKRAGLEARLAVATEQQAQASQLADDVRYIGRTADLLAGFRQAIVATVGPRLSVQASALFNELTAGEYDGLEVDPDTYEIRILDGGSAYASARFSGSEVDLANLALRVAISEHIRFQSGGQVGLLVLDEALASLDSDRKDRMLAALTRLSGRFRQILVVTHAPEVKERLPQAIEVVKLGSRRATARVVSGQ